MRAIFLNLLLIEAKLFPQSPYLASNILRFGEELDKLTKMIPEPNNKIVMSAEKNGGKMSLVNVIDLNKVCISVEIIKRSKNNSGKESESNG